MRNPHNMRYYLDPVFLSIKDDAWQEHKYEEIFLSLKGYLDRFDEIEEKQNKRFKLFKFHFSYSQYSQLFQCNPFVNSPEIYSGFAGIFQREILPNFMSRRAIFCPADDDKQCSLERESDPDEIPVVENPLVPEASLETWNELLLECALCGRTDDRHFFTLKETGSLAENRSYFAEVMESVDDFDRHFELSRLFPDPEGMDRDVQLRSAVEVCYVQKTANRFWEERKNQDFIFTEQFWHSVKAGKVAEESDEFKSRFIDSLTQVIYDRDDNIRVHDYKKNMQISDGTRRFKRWSADVFKMGEGSNKKCSRIFYYKEKGAVYFHEYNPDVH